MGDSLNERDLWLNHHVLDCFGDVDALRTLRFLLDLHAGNEADVIVLFDLLTIHPNL
jgi:hypothetical protein